jgi:hypothetical protein
MGRKADLVTDAQIDIATDSVTGFDGSSGVTSSGRTTRS